MSIEKCSQFRRFPEPGSSQWCEASSSPTDCGGFSDYCPMPDLFKPIRNVPRESITFSYQGEFASMCDYGLGADPLTVTPREYVDRLMRRAIPNDKYIKDIRD